MSSADDLALVVALPPGLAPGSAFSTQFAAPDLSQSPQLTVEHWSSAVNVAGETVIAWECFRGDANSWSGDATDLAQNKLAEIASGTAARMRGRSSPMHLVSQTSDARDRTLALDDGAGAARTLVAFTQGHAHGCFVTCTSGACESAVRDAHIEGAIVAPPAPGIALTSLSLVVHHPRGALGAALAVLVVAAAVAVVSRPGKTRR